MPKNYGSISEAGIISPAQITANQDDYAPTGFASAGVMRLNSDASRTITGLAGGAQGKQMTVLNVGSQDIVLADESASSTAGNRFALPFGDIIIQPDDGLILWYDITSSRWRMSAFTGGRRISAGGVILDPSGARNVMVWRAPFPCVVTNVRGHRKGGTGATVNARINQTSNHLSSALSLATADAWADGGAVQNATYVAGDDLEIMLVSITGAVTEIAIQVDFIRKA